MKATTFLTKGIGLASLFFIGRDAHLIGLAGKNKNPQAKIAESYPDMFINSQRLGTTSMMTTTSAFKKGYFNYCLEDSIMPAVHGFTGYCSGVKNALVNDVLPLSLTIGALALKRGGGICAAALAFLGIKTFIYDICGFGQYKKI